MIQYSHDTLNKSKDKIELKWEGKTLPVGGSHVAFLVMSSTEADDFSCSVNLSHDELSGSVNLSKNYSNKRQSTLSMNNTSIMCVYHHNATTYSWLCY